MNNLFERLASALEFKRRFTADAAHELRTPLAAIKLQAQVCQISQDESSRLHALSQVALSVDRASRLIDPLLGLARLDPLQSVTNAVSFDLGLLAQDVLKELRPAVHEKSSNSKWCCRQRR